MFESSLHRPSVTPSATIELLELHQLAQEFGQEQAHREALDAYCQRYYAMAYQHQQEHQAMQREPNMFALFWRRRRSQLG